jgi:hypothetical protein
MREKDNEMLELSVGQSECTASWWKTASENTWLIALTIAKTALSMITLATTFLKRFLEMWYHFWSLKKL